MPCTLYFLARILHWYGGAGSDYVLLGLLLPICKNWLCVHSNGLVLISPLSFANQRVSMQLEMGKMGPLAIQTFEIYLFFLLPQAFVGGIVSHCESFSPSVCLVRMKRKSLFLVALVHRIFTLSLRASAVCSRQSQAPSVNWVAGFSIRLLWLQNIAKNSKAFVWCTLLDAQKDSDAVESLQLGFASFLSLTNLRNPGKTDDFCFHSVELCDTSKMFLSWGCSDRLAYSCHCVPGKTKHHQFSFSLAACRWTGVFLDYLSFGSSESIYSARATTLYLDFSHQESWMQSQKIYIMSKVLQTLQCNIDINDAWQ